VPALSGAREFEDPDATAGAVSGLPVPGVADGGHRAAPDAAAAAGVVLGDLLPGTDQVGAIQVIVSNYERGKLRPHPDMIVRLAKALRVSADEMLGVQPARQNGAPVSRRVLRRLQAIDQLPKRDQDALFRTIDAFLQARRAS